MPGCAVTNCRTYDKITKGSDIVYHRFPKDPALIDIWISKCKRLDTLNTEKSWVCSRHFTADDYLRDLRAELLGLKPKKRLKPDAIPSINIPDFEPYVHEENMAEEEEKLPGMSPLAEIVLNFEGMCRLCMKQEKQMNDIFTERNSLPRKLCRILPNVKVCAGDGLPSQVCRQCVQQIDALHHFVTQCEVSDSTFRKYLNKQIISGNTELLPIMDIKQEKSDDEICSTLRISSTFSLQTENLNPEMSGFNHDSGESITESQSLETCGAKQNVSKSAVKIQNLHKKFEPRIISEHVKKNLHLQKQASNISSATPKPKKDKKLNNISITTLKVSDDKEIVRFSSSVNLQQPGSEAMTVNKHSSNMKTAVMLLKQDGNKLASNKPEKLQEFSAANPVLVSQQENQIHSSLKTYKYSRWKYFIPVQLLKQKSKLKLQNQGSDGPMSGNISNGSDGPMTGNTCNGSDGPMSGNTSSELAGYMSDNAFDASDGAMSGDSSNGLDTHMSDNTFIGSDGHISGNESDEAVFASICSGSDELVPSITPDVTDRVSASTSNVSGGPVSSNICSRSDTTKLGNTSNGTVEPVSDNICSGSDGAMSGISSNASLTDIFDGSDGSEEELMFRKPLMSLHTCKECGRKFASLGMFRRHQKAHIVHKCNDCGKVFSALYKLKLHAKKHSGAALCDVCGQCFTTFSSYIKHKQVHLKPEPYQCFKCNQFFTAKRLLQRHRRTHAADNTCICEQCGCAVRDKSTLIQHKKTVHAESHKCPLCPKIYRNKLSLKTHLMVHSGEKPFKCPECDRSFAYKDLLKKHSVVHTGEKKYACKYCDKTFTTSSYRLRHIGLHTGNTPYKCVDCNKIFTSRRDLNNHMQKVHGKQM